MRQSLMLVLAGVLFFYTPQFMFGSGEDGLLNAIHKLPLDKFMMLRSLVIGGAMLFCLGVASCALGN